MAQTCDQNGSMLTVNTRTDCLHQHSEIEQTQLNGYATRWEQLTFTSVSPVDHFGERDLFRTLAPLSFLTVSKRPPSSSTGTTTTFNVGPLAFKLGTASSKHLSGAFTARGPAAS
jgi:hypothetical protein